MPLLVYAVTAWVAGLLVANISYAVGVAPRWWPVALAVAGACAVLSAIIIRPAARAFPAIALSLITLAALLIGGSAMTTAASCIAALTQEHELTAAIDDRAHAGGRTTGTVIGRARLSGCSAHLTLRVTSGDAPPGALVDVKGKFRATARGIMAEGGVRPTGHVELLRGWRGRTGERIDSLFASNAALVRALLIADQDGIDHAVRDRFADAGLVHMLSISGLHVAIIAGALLTVASACRVPKRVATIAALITVACYVAALGAPPPAVRSAVMLATLAITEQIQRPVHQWTALALGAAIPTVQPAVVTDLGWQLSVAGMAALVSARAIVRRARTIDTHTIRPKVARQSVIAFRKLRGWRAGIARDLITGTVATIITAPLIAWTFGRVSVVAPIANIAAEPIVAVLQPALFLAIVLPWRVAAQLVADACVVPIALLDHVATGAAMVPWAVLHVAPTYAGACCAGVASASFVRATASRRWTPALIVSAGALVVALWTPAFARGSGRFELHMLDVGQGDAIAMRTPKGRWVLVDAGRRWDGGDAGRRVVVPYVQRLGGEVAAFVMTHAHDDHVGGAASVLRALHPARWMEPAFVTGNDAYRSSLAMVRDEQIVWQRVHPGDSLVLDDVVFQILAPDSAWTAAQNDANETSVMLRVQFGDVAMILTGDAEASEEAWVIAHTPANRLRADVLKLGHHGSRTSSTAEFVDVVQPSIGLVSVGQGNRYGHPSPDVLGDFAHRGIPLLRTDREGTIVVSTDGHDLIVNDRRERWAVSRRTR